MFKVFNVKKYLINSEKNYIRTYRGIYYNDDLDKNRKTIQNYHKIPI